MQSSSTPVLISVDLPRPGAEVGNYRVERQLGHGGMAVVYEARHRVLGKRVALKMLLPHHAACEELAQRFQREGEAAARLDHPHAVSVLDGGNDEHGTPYLVLEYLQGEDLATVLKREGPLSVEATLDLLIPMIAAISAAHELGIVHRDLKPENLFLARRAGQLVPKVLDFGISKTSETESLKLTRSESLLGTPHYMSPEQAQGAAQADARTDQFAIGVMLYECVTGQCPFKGDSLFAVLAAIVAGTPTPPRELVAELDPTFEAIVLRALSREPEARFSDLRALGAALLPLASPRVRLSYAAELNAPAEASSTLPPGPPAPASSTFSPEPPASTAVAASATLPPEPHMTARAPLLLGSAFVLAAAASLTAAALDDGQPPRQPEPDPVPASAGKPAAPAAQAPSAPAPKQVASGANSHADQSLTDDVGERRKPSGLCFDPVDAPSLCMSAEEDSNHEP